MKRWAFICILGLAVSSVCKVYGEFGDTTANIIRPVEIGTVDDLKKNLRENTYAKVGDAVPEFSVQMTDGTKIDMAELKGKVVIINFFTTRCYPCLVELKRVQKEIVDRFAGEDFVFIPISSGEDKATVNKFRKNFGHEFPIGLDPDRSIFKLFAERGVPRNFLIDRDGKVAVSEIEYDDKIFKELVTKAAELLKTE